MWPVFFGGKVRVQLRTTVAIGTPRRYEIVVVGAYIIAGHAVITKSAPSEIFRSSVQLSHTLFSKNINLSGIRRLRFYPY